MAIKFLQLLTSPQRSTKTNFQLGCLLAFVAGAVNAGGFLAISRYTSHMSGIISGIGDDLALSNILAVLGGVSLLLSFIIGSAATAILVNWGQRKHIHSQFALPLLVEAFLLLCFGLLGANLNLYTSLTVPTIALMLCFVMGLQNAIITKVSRAEIRTTHMTGVVTDIGIELGKLFYWNRSEEANKKGHVRANKQKLKAHALILSMFLIGGIVGALSFKRVGYGSVIPLSLVLIIIASLQIYRDIRVLIKGPAF
ncbi:YoaK family protein [Polynucleobacter sp. MWH-UH25E]|uniref:YoaK family protein n=1 Tax=Polynucleobacter sp. MWH-UH25E TaxID=1855616 RepID=UPI001BFE58A5|nr:YoaK family protein [Polynucleobacter sp. MWH-UH25E]QWD62808.1 DUF1275 domain-containing protein [Polynucleobacter sp. MWH-UH25E]